MENTLNERINDYNRGEITIDQFFSSIGGLNNLTPTLKTKILNYLMENDKEENKTPNPKHNIALADKDGELGYSLAGGTAARPNVRHSLIANVNYRINLLNAG